MLTPAEFRALTAVHNGLQICTAAGRAELAAHEGKKDDAS